MFSKICSLKSPISSARLVFYAGKAHPHLRRRQRLDAHRRLVHDRRTRRMPRDELGHRFIDERLKRFLPRLMTADHLLFARLDHPGVLRTMAAGENRGPCPRSKPNQPMNLRALHEVPSLGYFAVDTPSWNIGTSWQWPQTLTSASPSGQRGFDALLAPATNQQLFRRLGFLRLFALRLRPSRLRQASRPSVAILIESCLQFLRGVRGFARQGTDLQRLLFLRISRHVVENRRCDRVCNAG